MAEEKYKDLHTPLPEQIRRTAPMEGRGAERSARLGKILVELGQELSSVATPQEAARLILNAADRLLGWDAAAVDLLDGEEGYSLVSFDTIQGERKEFTRHYGKIPEGSMFWRTLHEGPQIILRNPKDADKMANLRSFGDESHPSAALLFVPIRKGEDNIGMMTVQSYTYEYYDRDDLRLLQVLGDYCSGCLGRTFAELRLREAEQKRRELLQDLQERERIMNHDLALASELQQRFLPDSYPFPDQLRCGAFYRACTLVGGDLYDIRELTPDLCLFYIADVAGHGVSAALVTAILKANVDRGLRLFVDPADTDTDATVDLRGALHQFMEQLNRATCEVVSAGGFITIQLGIMRVRSGDLHLVNAGHTPPLLREAATGDVREVPVPSNIPAGLMPHHQFKVISLRLMPGDKLLVYTDGISERLDEEEREFGPEGILNVLQKEGRTRPDEIARAVQLANDQFAAGFTPEDDQALLVIERLG